MIEELPFEQGFALAEFRRYCEESAQKRLESLVPGFAAHLTCAGRAAAERQAVRANPTRRGGG
jgi:hypothetical protein